MQRIALFLRIYNSKDIEKEREECDISDMTALRLPRVRDTRDYATCLSTYIYQRFHFHRAPMYSRWSRPQTLSVLGCQASRTRQEPRIRRCPWGVSRPIAPPRRAILPRLSNSAASVARGSTISRLARRRSLIGVVDTPQSRN